MRGQIGAAVWISCGFLTFLQVSGAAETTVPEPFRGFDDASELTIYYDDLSDLLRMVVVDVGPSDRTKTDPMRPVTGTRMKHHVRRLTASEGNRFLYESFKDNEKARRFLRNIQKRLEHIPSETPLEKFSRDEQLAYWLNLYNVTVLNEIVEVYPKKSLKKLSKGRNSLFAKKLLTVDGVDLSLNDIQFTILKQNYFGDPLIIYGLYQGIVGGPDIRSSAYYGDNVYVSLEENALRFINSNRGTLRDDPGIFRVSSFYGRNSDYFPEFEADLSAHLLPYLQDDEKAALIAADEIKPDIDDWTVTDLGVNRHRIGGSFANNQAAMLDSYRGNSQSRNGGVLTAPVILSAEENEEEQRKESIAIKDIERFPVEGSNVEEIGDDDKPEPAH